MQKNVCLKLAHPRREANRCTLRDGLALRSETMLFLEDEQAPMLRKSSLSITPDTLPKALHALPGTYLQYMMHQIKYVCPVELNFMYSKVSTKLEKIIINSHKRKTNTY